MLYFKKVGNLIINFNAIDIFFFCFFFGHHPRWVGLPLANLEATVGRGGNAGGIDRQDPSRELGTGSRAPESYEGKQSSLSIYFYFFRVR